MVRFAAAALALAATLLGSRAVGAEILLLDFWSPSCGPCMQMKPTIQAFEQANYPIRQIDTSREPQLARQYGVERIPCFVMLVDDQEVDRQVGAISSEQLQQMFARAKTIAEERSTRPRPIAGNESAWSSRTVARGDVVRHRSQRNCRLRPSIKRRIAVCEPRQTARRDRSAARGRSPEPRLRHGHDHRLPERRSAGDHVRPLVPRVQGQGARDRGVV